MRLICPHCMSGVTVPDDAAGRDATCPNCGKSFPTPARYSAQVALDPPAPPVPAPAPHPAPEVAPLPAERPAAPPPGYVPPAPPPAPTGSGFLPPTPAQAEVPTAAGYAKSIGFTLSPRVFSWLPAVLLLLTLVFTCFPWVGSYAGDSAVYSQRPWNAQFGYVSRNYALEKAIAIPAGWLDRVRADWELMVPYLLCLILVTMLAWADRGFHSLDPRRVPPLAGVWPHRHAIILGLATFVFLLSLIQVLNGFGMERAIRKTVSEQFAESREKAKAAGSEAAQNRIEKYEEDVAYKAYNIERTSWLYLALLCNLLAVLAIVVRFLLERRGNKPPPKLLLHY